VVDAVELADNEEVSLVGELGWDITRDCGDSIESRNVLSEIPNSPSFLWRVNAWTGLNFGGILGVDKGRAEMDFIDEEAVEAVKFVDSKEGSLEEEFDRNFEMDGDSADSICVPNEVCNSTILFWGVTSRVELDCKGISAVDKGRAETDFIDEEAINAVELVRDEEGLLVVGFGRGMAKVCAGSIESIGAWFDSSNGLSRPPSFWNGACNSSTASWRVPCCMELCCWGVSGGEEGGTEIDFPGKEVVTVAEFINDSKVVDAIEHVDDEDSAEEGTMVEESSWDIGLIIMTL
jgi:hypothetical protein